MTLIANLEGKSHSSPAALNLRTDEYVCWSRMQAEAGQPLSAIVARKELERHAGGGVFFWGVGNPPALAASVLARAEVPVRAVFSIMKSRPKPADVAPARTFVWRQYIDFHGVARPLPAHVLITSRADSGTGLKRTHYALMCRSEAPLRLEYGTPFDPDAYRNASSTGGRVGASQVTALLRRIAIEDKTSDYAINMTASLNGSYWVRLAAPDLLDPERLSTLAQLEKCNEYEWRAAVSKIRRDDVHTPSAETYGHLL